KVLSILADKDKLPALVHCPDGRVLSGVVLWCLRRLQCWDDRASAAEFARFSGVLPSREVEKFVESYGEEVTVPANVPRWLWGGDRAHWHPCIRIRHQPPLEVFEPDPLPSQQTLRWLKNLTHAHATNKQSRGEVYTRTDYLRVRRGYMHANNKVPGGGGGGGGSGGAGGGGGGGSVGARGQGTGISSRRRSASSGGQALQGPLSLEDSFSQDMQANK
ncbi:unnamed protein product, partial [Ectocarpus fasciculatus]